MDVEHLRVIRHNVDSFFQRAVRRYVRAPARILEVGPEEFGGVARHCALGIQIETMDLRAGAGCTHVGDICKHNPGLPDSAYDFVVCAEVLEHTLRPFEAVKEIYRLLKPAGRLLATVPFNFRIHGPLPDCWRFSEHGLRALLDEFEIEELEAVETPDRPLMPVHYTVVARKP